MEVKKKQPFNPSAQPDTVFVQTLWMHMDLKVATNADSVDPLTQSRRMRERLGRLTACEMRGLRLFTDLAKRFDVCYDKVGPEGSRP